MKTIEILPIDKKSNLMDNNNRYERQVNNLLFLRTNFFRANDNMSNYEAIQGRSTIESKLK